MKKIRKIREVKPKIREIKEIEHEKKSELVEDIKEAEQDFREETIATSSFKAPILLQSEVEPQQTKIQTETVDRQELEKINVQYERSAIVEPSQPYSPSAAPQTSLSEDMVFSPRNPVRQFRSQGDPRIRNVLESTERRESQYDTERAKRKKMPWEV